MKYISLNVHGLHDEWRRGIVGWYLSEWGVMVICLQETTLESCEAWDWNLVGCCFLERYLGKVADQSEWLIVAWIE